MSTTPSGIIRASDVRTALNVTNNASGSTNYPTNTISFNDYLVRVLAARPSGAISMNDMRNKAGPEPYGTLLNQVCSGSTLVRTLSDGRFGSYNSNIANSPSCLTTLSYLISGTTYNFDMRATAISLGWGGSSPLAFTVTIDVGQFVVSSSTGSYAFYISPSFPAGSSLTLINKGCIVGRGGNGGAGGNGPIGVAGGNAGASGGGGGPALYVGYSTSISNLGLIGAGGGGGGGGGGEY